MNKTLRIAILSVTVLSASTAFAQDSKKEMFNPVNTAVTSQTLAPDAGILPSTLSPFPVPVFH